MRDGVGDQIAMKLPLNAVDDIHHFRKKHAPSASPATKITATMAMVTIMRSVFMTFPAIRSQSRFFSGSFGFSSFMFLMPRFANADSTLSDAISFVLQKTLHPTKPWSARKSDRPNNRQN